MTQPCEHPVNDPPSKFSAVLDRLTGLVIWDVAAAAITESAFSVDAGHRLPVAPVSKYSPTEQGEYGLYVKCAWRLEGEDTTVCTWQDDRSEGGRMLNGLRSMVGRRIISARAGPPSWDLTVQFDGGLRLLVFCDISTEDPDPECYDLFSPDTSFGVLAGGSIEAEVRFGPDPKS